MENRKNFIRKKAREYFKEYGIEEYTLEFNSRITRSLGRCNPSRKRIELQTNYVLYGKEDQLLDTLKHEIAHALDWKRNRNRRHGQSWKKICVEIGCKPKTQKSDPWEEGFDESATKKYTLECTSCGRKSGMARRPKRTYSCNACSPGRFDPAYKLKILQNY